MGLPGWKGVEKKCFSVLLFPMFYCSRCFWDYRNLFVAIEFFWIGRMIDWEESWDDFWDFCSFNVRRCIGERTDIVQYHSSLSDSTFSEDNAQNLVSHSLSHTLSYFTLVNSRTLNNKRTNIIQTQYELYPVRSFGLIHIFISTNSRPSLLT